MIHPEMMSTALVGCDVLPAAAHLTASMLASAHPTVKYKGSSIIDRWLWPTGRRWRCPRLTRFARPPAGVRYYCDHGKGCGRHGRERTRDTGQRYLTASFDLVIMNPPFTRDTGHEGEKIGVPNPMFAAFGSKEEEQREMAKAAKRLLQGTSAHGNAGEASAFLVLADRKLKDSGTLAMVMPLSLMSGEAWEAFATATTQIIWRPYFNIHCRCEGQ